MNTPGEDLAPVLERGGHVDAAPLLRAVVEAKIAEQHVSSEPLHYDLSPVLLPGADGQAMAAYLLILSVKSPLLSPPRIAVPEIIADAYPSESQIGAAVASAVAMLAAARKQILRPERGGGYHPGAN
jgi:hypothetical protein